MNYLLNLALIAAFNTYIGWPTIHSWTASHLIRTSFMDASHRNHKLCMIFRIGDMRHDSFIVNAALSVKVIRRKVTGFEFSEKYHIFQRMSRLFSKIRFLTGSPLQDL